VVAAIELRAVGIGEQGKKAIASPSTKSASTISPARSGDGDIGPCAQDAGEIALAMKTQIPKLSGARIHLNQRRCDPLSGTTPSSKAQESLVWAS
jgi:hypothetical protein